MTRYLVYSEEGKKPIKKFKNENDVFIFISDFRNLQQYGCMTAVCDNDGARQLWDDDIKAWVAMEDKNE